MKLWLSVRALAAADEADAAPPWMSADEAQRWARFAAPRRRAEFVCGRRSARDLLAAAFGGAPADWSLSAADGGPPQLRAGPRTDVRVAISHSHGHVACAVSAAPLGIDIEQPVARRRVDALVPGVCSEAERHAFDALDERARATHFHRLWTIKEAWFKARGEGISPTSMKRLSTRPARASDVQIAHVWQRADGLALSVWCAADATVEWRADDAGLNAASVQRWAVDDDLA